jgi:predicted alpha/beta hydrolase family esterase
MKKQIVVIHGGETFDSYEEYLKYLLEYQIDFAGFFKKGWKQSLGEKLGEEYQVIAPRMPSAMNAKYIEWKIYFDKLVPFIEEDAICIGHSLGGVFLAKYLSENTVTKKMKAIYLIAAPYGDQEHAYSLADFKITAPLTGLVEQSSAVFLYHSEDDPVVPFSDLGKYAELLPTAHTRVFNDRRHFDQEELPELIADIKSLG